MIIVINIGEYFLGRKLLKENNKLNKDNYEKNLYLIKMEKQLFGFLF